MFSDHLLARTIALSYYGKEPRIELIARRKNAVFRLHFPDGCKVLKLAPDSEGDFLRKEEIIFHSLLQHDIPAPIVEHTDDGSRFGRPLLLTASAGAQTVADWIGSRGELSTRLFTNMGALLASIHNLDYPPTDVGCRNLHQDVAAVNRQAGELVEQGLLNRDETARLSSLDVPPLHGAVLCHGDFHAIQCVVHQERITAVVDWESAWAGNALVDLAIAHTYLDYFCPFDLILAFFAGYTSLCPLPPEYERTYLSVRMAQALGLIGFFHKQGQSGKVERAVELYRAYCRYLDK